MSDFTNEGPSLQDLLENCDAPDEDLSDFQDALEDNKMKNVDETPQDVDNTIIEEVNIDDFKDLNEAKKAKEEGNDFFRNKDYINAIESYTRAIATCPDNEKESLAIFYGNRAAAYNALGPDSYDLVIEDCTQALEYNNNYIKVLVRRYQTFEKKDKYDMALDDAKKVQELDSSYPKIQFEISRLERIHNEKMEEMKTEAMGKLKDLGNSILGNFGMSVDDFKFQQDPSTGSWSMNMGQNGK